MKLHLQHSNVQHSAPLDQWLRSSLHSLLPLVNIQAAKVSLEYVHEASPPYRVQAHLVIPGPDLHAEAVDHTPRTAVAKLMAQLRCKVVERAAKRLRRSAGRGRLPSPR